MTESLSYPEFLAVFDRAVAANRELHFAVSRNFSFTSPRALALIEQVMILHEDIAAHIGVRMSKVSKAA